jgi:hypothetical protein
MGLAKPCSRKGPFRANYPAPLSTQYEGYISESKLASRHSSPNADADTNTDGDSYTNAYPNPYAYHDSTADFHSDGDGYTQANPGPDFPADQVPKGYSGANPDADLYLAANHGPYTNRWLFESR